MSSPTALKFIATPEQGRVSALALRPPRALAQLLLAHGAGTDMRHYFLEELSQALAVKAIATLRYNFPYKEKGRGGGPNGKAVLTATVRSAAEHLSHVDLPMLFLQGPRDTLATPKLMGPVAKRLGKLATLHIVEGADHGFKVLKRSGRPEQEVILELAETAAIWIGRRA